MHISTRTMFVFLNSANPTTTNPDRLRRGFTLIEVLVVIVILSVLITLALVGTRKLRENAAVTQSVANLRACTGLLLKYAAEHNNEIVCWTTNGRTWPNLLAHSGIASRADLEKIIRSPVEVGQLPHKTIPPSSWDYVAYGMDYNAMQIDPDPTDPTKNQRWFRVHTKPGAFLVLGDSIANMGVVANRQRFDMQLSSPNPPATPLSVVHFRNNGKALFSLLDGSVRTFTPRELMDHLVEHYGKNTGIRYKIMDNTEIQTINP